jgi:hypothetical protein
MDGDGVRCRYGRHYVGVSCGLIAWFIDLWILVRDILALHELRYG